MKRIKEDKDFVWYDNGIHIVKLNKMEGRTMRPEDLPAFNRLSEAFAPAQDQPRHVLWRTKDPRDWKKR